MQTVKVEKSVNIKLFDNDSNEMPDLSLPPLVVAKFVVELFLSNKKFEAVEIIRQTYFHDLLESKVICNAIWEIYQDYPAGDFYNSLDNFYNDYGLPRV